MGTKSLFFRSLTINSELQLVKLPLTQQNIREHIVGKRVKGLRST